MESTRLTLSKTGLTYDGGVLTRTDGQGATLMSLSADRFGNLRLERRYHAGGVIFLVPGLSIAGLTAQFADQAWVKIVFYSLAALLGLVSAFAFKGSCIVVPGGNGHGDLVIQVIENHDQAEAFVFSVNKSKEPAVPSSQGASEQVSRQNLGSG
jgi:hypothetical protein